MMKLPDHKTKIVCTIGPASESLEVMEHMIDAGMNIARLNFSHGNFERHRKIIEKLRCAASRSGRRLTLMADLPGPKMRIGQLKSEPIVLKPGDYFRLTTDDIEGDGEKVSVTFSRLPHVVKPGDMLFLNDGLIQLEVQCVEASDVLSRVLVGGELRSRKGLNLPGIALGISAFTDHDRKCLEFALAQGVDAICQSFVESDGDVIAVREAAASLGHHVFIIAKIERSNALQHIDSILDAADGIMVARGDLGVEIPIEEIALVQKKIIHKANLMGKPVITATQMLESMTWNLRPTRAEATDVANAILDGTDCVMLSGESAMGQYPVEAVKMLARIATVVEPHNPRYHVRETLESMGRKGQVSLTDLVTLSVEAALEKVSPAAVFVPTRSGATARNIARFRLPVWIVAVSADEAACQRLQFTYGVYPVHEPVHPEVWKEYAWKWMRDHHVEGDLVVVTEGPSRKYPETNNRIEFIDLSGLARSSR